MNFKFNHFNFNVSNLESSLKFYKQNLDLTESHRMAGARNAEAGGNFTIVYLNDGTSDFELELTYLHNHPQKYDLGECEFHLAMEVDNYEKSLAKHQEMGVVSFINEEMGIYFVEDPDGYWIEIIPKKIAS